MARVVDKMLMANGPDTTSIGYHQFLSDVHVLMQQHNFDKVQLDVASETHNGTVNGTDAPDDEYYQGLEVIFVPIVFGLIFFVGVVGNGTLIYTVLMNRTMRNTPNILLVSLAIGDLFLIFFTVPFMSTTYTFEEWPYGEVMCKLGEFTVALSLGVSVFTLTALSAERYMVIVHPMSAVNRGASSATVRTVLVVVGIWVVSATLGSVELYTAHLSYDIMENRSMAVCHPYPSDWGSWYVATHIVVRFVIYFAVPILVIGVFYTLMARMLMVSTTLMPGDGVKGQAVKQLEARKKVARLVLSFVVVFMICWLPRHIWYFWFNFDPGQYNMFWHIFKIVAFCLSYVNSCVNPLALYFLSRQFRRYYNRYLCPCCAACFPTSTTTIAVGGTTEPAGGGVDRYRNHLRNRRILVGGTGVEALPGETSQLTRLNSVAAVAALGPTVERKKKQHSTSMTMLTTMAH